MGWEGLDRYRAQFEQEAELEFGVVVRAQKKQIGVAMLQQVDQLTPVNIGEARAGWHFTLAPADDVQGQDNLTALAAIVDESKPEADLYLANFVEHMVVIDQGLYEHDTPATGSEWGHVPNAAARAALRAGPPVILVKGGYHVSAPRGVAGVAADQVAADFGLARTTEN